MLNIKVQYLAVVLYFTVSFVCFGYWIIITSLTAVIILLQVLSSGKVIEFDTPFNLLQSAQSVFRSMVDKTGPLESAKLKKIAQLKSQNLLYS